MRTRLDDLVTATLQRGSAVPAFTCYDFTTALGVVSAAEDVQQGVILLVAPKTAATSNGLRLITALRGLADAASVPVAVQLDHATDLNVMAQSVGAGADSVLADGSSLPYEDNIQLVRAARALLGNKVVLEAELGGLAGDEDRAFGLDHAGVPVAALTDPSQVNNFVDCTGAELLAVAVGNVHGRYVGDPRLRWDVLEDIRGRISVPMVLHGASGIAQQELAKVPEMNIGKVNFNTELRTGILTTLQEQLPGHRRDGENMQGLVGYLSTSAKAFALSALSTLCR